MNEKKNKKNSAFCGCWEGECFKDWFEYEIDFDECEGVEE